MLIARRANETSTKYIIMQCIARSAISLKSSLRTLHSNGVNSSIDELQFFVTTQSQQPLNMRNNVLSLFRMEKTL